jgi:hypothetical protein
LRKHFEAAFAVSGVSSDQMFFVFPSGKIELWQHDRMGREN